MNKMIIDTDCGSGLPGADIDDALAIAVALLSPNIDLLGVTTVSANAEVEFNARADADRFKPKV